MFGKPVTVIFDEILHQYKDPKDMAVIPSTTQIANLLEISGDYSNIPNIKWYQDRGTLSHYGLENFILLGNKDVAIAMAQDKEKELTAKWDECKGFFESGLKFLNLNPMKNIETEKRFIGNVNGCRYAGTIDIVSDALDGAKAVVDWKTSKDVRKEAYYLQIGAYALAQGAEIGCLVGLKEDGSDPDVVFVDVPKYSKMFADLVEIFYADIPDEEKRTKAKTLVFGSIQITKDKAVLLAEKNDELKAVKKEVDDLKAELTGNLGGVNGFYEDETVKVSLTYVPGSTKKSVNTETLIVALAEHIGSDLLKEIVANNTEEKETAGSYRLTTKITGPSKEKEPKPKKEKKKEKPEPEPAPVEDPTSVVPEGIKVVSLEMIESLVASKNWTKNQIEMYWILVEGMFGCCRDAEQFDRASAYDMAKVLTAKTLDNYIENKKAGRVI